MLHAQWLPVDGRAAACLELTQRLRGREGRERDGRIRMGADHRKTGSQPERRSAAGARRAVRPSAGGDAGVRRRPCEAARGRGGLRWPGQRLRPLWRGATAAPRQAEPRGTCEAGPGADRPIPASREAHGEDPTLWPAGRGDPVQSGPRTKPGSRPRGPEMAARPVALSPPPAGRAPEHSPGRFRRPQPGAACRLQDAGRPRPGWNKPAVGGRRPADEPPPVAASKAGAFRGCRECGLR